MLQQAGLCSSRKRGQAASPWSGGQAGGDTGEKANQSPFPFAIPQPPRYVVSIKKKERKDLDHRGSLVQTVSIKYCVPHI